MTPKREFVVDHPEVKKVQALLGENNIGHGAHYPLAVHQQPAFAYLGQPGDFPVAERICNHIISLPMFAELGLDRIAGNDPYDHEDQKRRDEKDRDQLQNSADEVAQHRTRTIRQTKWAGPNRAGPLSSQSETWFRSQLDQPFTTTFSRRVNPNTL